MNKILMIAACTLLAAGLHGQTATGTDSPGATSSQDQNIRAYIELLRTDVKKAKSQVMGLVMQLDPEQATKFWPIYKDFETELSVLGDGILAIVKEYAANYENMTGSVADRLATNLLTIEQQRNSLKKKYYEQFREKLDPITAIRFLQVENQLERLIDLQIASELPVVMKQ